MKVSVHLTSKQALEMRKRYQSGEKIGALASEYGVHYNTANMHCNPELRAKQVMNQRKKRERLKLNGQVRS